MIAETQNWFLKWKTINVNRALSKEKYTIVTFNNNDFIIKTS